MQKALLTALFVLLPACGDKAPASSPTTPAASDPSASSSVSPAPTTEATAEAPVRKRKPFDLYNGCSEVVTVVFAEDAKAANAGKRTVAANASIEGPRDNDGNQTVWLLDDKGEPLVKVRVSRGMKRVEIGKSCRTLDAR